MSSIEYLWQCPVDICPLLSLILETTFGCLKSCINHCGRPVTDFVCGHGKTVTLKKKEEKKKEKKGETKNKKGREISVTTQNMDQCQ